MGIWDANSGIRTPGYTPPYELPMPGDKGFYVDENGQYHFPDERPIGQAIDNAKDTVKTIRNVGRRIMSFFNDDESKKLKKGDVIGICRGVYDHYGVYESDGCVIHYSSKDSDTSSDNSIIVTNLDEFARGDDTIFKLLFLDEYRKPSKVVAQTSSIMQRPEGMLLQKYYEALEKSKKFDYKLYSADETVERAKSRVGEHQYSLKNNNCEHFAIWCKTGISESHQVNALLEIYRVLRRLALGF